MGDRAASAYLRTIGQSAMRVVIVAAIGEEGLEQKAREYLEARLVKLRTN